MSTGDGVEITGPVGPRFDEEEMATIAETPGDAYASGRWDDARALFTETALSDEYHDFLTGPAYERTP